MDAEGLVVDAIPAETRMVYVTPSHQYPLGVLMSLPRRIALLSWASRCGGVIVEDDYDGEFRYGGRPAETLQSLDRDGRVCYVGSFSKVLLPTLRLGFLIAPPALRSALRKAKYVTDWHTELPTQAALARFIGEGALSSHIRRMRRIYRERHEIVSTALRGDLAPWLRPVPSATGLHVAPFSTQLSVTELQEISGLLRADGLAIAPLSTYAVGPRQQSGLVLGYGMTSPDELRTGLSMLRDALQNLEQPTRPATPPAGSAGRGQGVTSATCGS